jgi:hypothetical protein
MGAIMSTACSYPDPQILGEAGRKIYQRKYQQDFEQRYLGKIVGINLTSEQAIVGESLEEVMMRGHRADPTSLYYFFKVGAPGVFRCRLVLAEPGGQSYGR